MPRPAANRNPPPDAKRSTPSTPALPRYRVDPQSDGHDPIATEWLLTNGTGAFAMGSVIGLPTRRYHGLLIAAEQQPVGRINALHSIAEKVIQHDRAFELANYEFAADHGGTVIHPEGWKHLIDFQKTPTEATWTYQIEQVHIRKSLRLIWKRQLAVLRYQVHLAGRKPKHSEPIRLELRPMVALRDFHGLRHEGWTDGFAVEAGERDLNVRQYDSAMLHLAADAGRFVPADDWWRNFHYRVDADRQQDHVEALFNPGWFDWSLDLTAFSADEPAELNLAFGIEPIDWDAIHAPDARAAHLVDLIDRTEQRASLPSKPKKHREALRQLAAASDDFVVDRTVGGEPSTTILAGYPWFGDWGRDTMIALPGCLLATGRFDEARATLRTFAAHVKDGLIPNRFDDYGGDPCYNTVGAPLWFIDAAMKYHHATGDEQTWRRDLMPACRQIVDRYATGTHYRIFMDRDGLISAGTAETQLTWMDAARDGVVFTPRYGKAVEVNGLWYNALVGLTRRVDDEHAQRYRQLAERAARSFMPTFWSAERGYFADHITPEGHTDWSLRPNQCIAAALPHSPIPSAEAKVMIRQVRDRLLTPMGIRTLPTDDPNYHGRHAGSMFERDRAYHQGTVWTWLTGPFIEAWLRAHEFSADSRAEAIKMLQPMLDEVGTHALGSLHEIYDGDPPHAPQGCPAQAWSVSEVLRSLILAAGGMAR